MERRSAIKMLLTSIGITASSQTLITLVQASQQNHRPKKPYFNASQRAFIKQLNNTILPETSTPGAETLKLQRFVETMVKETFPEKQQNMFVDGLRITQELFNKSMIVDETTQQDHTAHLTQFLSITDEQRATYQILDDLPPERIPAEIKVHYYQYKFLFTLRALLIIGFMHHEEIAKLQRDAKDFPVTYIPGNC
ncbi:gluconate 2-dehydrogenase subunit 3 family protein [Thalassotalea sediminis]|uniref:gluconate 2-dehydrogenase subunit 3 family protein n=1 Tax=Thalassotalea sediminis TaxID=1759089 RepID=UPI002573C145|nr:gluconate 2-dehydrogenase subunit 3 family protein [Thalassotalea sediminis]